MKKKKVILVLLFICFSTIFLVFTFYNENNAIENGSTIEMQENTSIASLNSIKTSLTTSGEIVSGNTEKISLNTDYSFFTMCVEEEESVTEGQKLIKYTNGTYETAPFDGIITEYSVPTVNENCEANHYIEISSTQDLSVQISILEDQMSYIESGKEVEIVPNFDETKKFTGSIEKINEIGSYTNGNTSFTAIAGFKNDGTLKIGMSASCTIILEEAENVLTIPLEALQTDDEQNNYVTVINDDGTSTKQEVEIGIQNDAYVQIVSGLSEENKIEVQETSTDNSNSFNNFMPGDGMGRQNMGDGNPPERIGETPGFNDK